MSIKSLLKKKLSRYLYNSAYSRSLFTLCGVVIKEVRVSFIQFFSWKKPLTTFFRSLGIAISSIVRLLLGRSLKFSYAYIGEDRILEGIYKPLITQDINH